MDSFNARLLTTLSQGNQNNHHVGSGGSGMTDDLRRRN